MEERVRCLELGADDVVLKPFSFHELRARLKVLCRRRERFEETVLRFADLEMDRAERKVTQDGREVQLTATEFSLLESLMRRRGERICGREELLREVWRAPAGMGTNIVEVYINYLRRKLGQSLNRSGRSRSLIRTVRGKGYVLADRGSQMAESWSEIEDLERKAG
jgi:DNA-binding response OmpR family regulator